MAKSRTRQKIEDGRFLAENFSIAPQNAAGLVAGDTADADTVDTEVRRAAQDGDDATADLAVDTDEERHKPVLHGRNKRTGGA